MLLNDLQEWRRPDLYVEKPPPLVIEVALDTSHLRQDQALLYEDENGQTREVPAGSTSPSSPGASRSSRRYRDIVLERWTIELGDSEGYSSKDLSEPLPTVYKKGIVAFRTLYSQLRMLPAWKLYRQLSRQPGNQQQLRLKYRIRQADDPLLHQPLTPQEQDNGLLSQLELGESDGGSLPRRADIDAARPVRGAHRQPPGGDAASIRLRLRPLTTPAGPLLVSVDYRRHCGFRSASEYSPIPHTRSWCDLYLHLLWQTRYRMRCCKHLPSIDTVRCSPSRCFHPPSSCDGICICDGSIPFTRAIHREHAPPSPHPTSAVMVR